MAETEHAPVADTESFSKEYVDRLKADLVAKSEEASVLRAYKSGHEQKTRDVIATLQPDVNSFVDTIMQDHKDHAAEMASMKEWATSCHQSAAIDTAYPLARLMSCASATMKRTREEASVASQNSETLGATMKELESVKQELASKTQRISELEVFCTDQQKAAEKMQDELARAGLLKERFDFSKISSREAAAPAEPASVVETSALQTITSNASKGKVEDMLFSYVNKNSSGGGLRIRQSSTNHPHLGALGNSAEQELRAAIGFGY
jgi:uncharacterized coiled-coil protein SlyX